MIKKIKIIVINIINIIKNDDYDYEGGMKGTSDNEVKDDD